MARTQVLLGILLCMGVFVEVSAEVVPFTKCDEFSYRIDGDDSSRSGSPSTPPPKNCSIAELRVTPCPEVTTGKPCKVKRGTTVTIEFDFIPRNSAESLTGRVYWHNTLSDVPLLGIDSNACNYTTCPIRPNKTYTYAYVLPIAQRLPVRVYQLKWKLWSDDLECCYMTKIKLVR